LFEYVHNILWIWNRKDEQLKQHKQEGWIYYVCSVVRYCNR